MLLDYLCSQSTSLQSIAVSLSCLRASQETYEYLGSYHKALELALLLMINILHCVADPKVWEFLLWVMQDLYHQPYGYFGSYHRSPTARKNLALRKCDPKLPFNRAPMA